MYSMPRLSKTTAPSDGVLISVIVGALFTGFKVAWFSGAVVVLVMLMVSAASLDSSIRGGPKTQVPPELHVTCRAMSR
jgi:hypothetical protein